jgi:hypothetical protein
MNLLEQKLICPFHRTYGSGGNHSLSIVSNEKDYPYLWIIEVWDNDWREWEYQIKALSGSFSFDLQLISGISFDLRLKILETITESETFNTADNGADEYIQQIINNNNNKKREEK